MLTGASIGALVLPRRLKLPVLLGGLGVFAALAFAPDVPAPGWGHHRYIVSHSAFVNGGIVLAAVVVLGLFRPVRRVVGGWLVILGGAMAWMSHLMLDSLYNHGHGVIIGWPWSRFCLNLPLPWFHTLYTDRPSLGPDNLRVLAIELCFYLPVFLLCLWFRRRPGRHGSGSDDGSARAFQQVGGRGDGQIHTASDGGGEDNP